MAINKDVGGKKKRKKLSDLAASDDDDDGDSGSDFKLSESEAEEEEEEEEDPSDSGLPEATLIRLSREQPKVRTAEKLHLYRIFCTS